MRRRPALRAPPSESTSAETGTELASDFDEAWDASGRHVTFLGDWHTHPGGPTVPSERDREAMEKLATQSAYRTPEPLIVIVQSPWPWSRTSRDFTCYLRRSNEAVVALALF